MSRKQYFRKQKLFGLGMAWFGIAMAVISFMLSWGSLAVLSGAVVAAGIGLSRTKQMILAV